MDELDVNALLGGGFDPNNYMVESETNVYPLGENGELPKYTTDELKMDIEPMLYDLSGNELGELISWMVSTRTSQKVGGNIPQEDVPQEDVLDMGEQIDGGYNIGDNGQGLDLASLANMF